MMRRIIAGAILLVAVVIVTWQRADGGVVWLELALNLASAIAAFAFLHARWRRRERSEMTPATAEDIFS